MPDSRGSLPRRRNSGYRSSGERRELGERSQASNYEPDDRLNQRLESLSQTDYTNSPDRSARWRSPATESWANRELAQPTNADNLHRQSDEVTTEWFSLGVESTTNDSPFSRSYTSKQHEFTTANLANRSSTQRMTALNGTDRRNSSLTSIGSQPASRDGAKASFSTQPGEGRENRRDSRRTSEFAVNSDRASQLESDKRPYQRARRRRAASRPRSRGFTAMLYVARMTICSIGVGVLVGTVLSAWDPANRAPADASTQTSTVSTPISTPAATPTAVLPGQDLSALQSTVEALATKYSASNPALVASAYVLDVDTNSHVDVNGSVSLAAASVIKVPILVAFLQAVDSGKIRLDESLVMRKELVAQEAGDMQYRPVGSKFSAIETATKMITISDNTATNILIERLGGTAVLNEQFKSWGLANTVLANLLPDVEGTNLTSTKDMTLLLARISKGELLSARSRDRLLDILRKTINNSMLPQGIEHGSTIAHKTGTIAISVGDVGLVDLPNGKRYAISALVKRAPNDRRAINLIQQTSRAVYQHFIQPPTPPLANPSPVTQSHLHQTTTSDRSATQKQANQP